MNKKLQSQATAIGYGGGRPDAFKRWLVVEFVVWCKIGEAGEFGLPVRLGGNTSGAKFKLKGLWRVPCSDFDTPDPVSELLANREEFTWVVNIS